MSQYCCTSEVEMNDIGYGLYQCTTCLNTRLFKNGVMKRVSSDEAEEFLKQSEPGFGTLALGTLALGALAVLAVAATRY